MYFKHQFPFEERKKEALRVMNKYPDRIPVICEKNIFASKNCPNINKTKYLVPRDITLGEFLCQVRRRIKLKSDNTIFFFIDKIMPSTTWIMQDIYRKYAAEDLFLYITYSQESVFGFHIHF